LIACVRRRGSAAPGLFLEDTRIANDFLREERPLNLMD
jgi:hypothetical protein